jgi:hypothetical protein
VKCINDPTNPPPKITDDYLVMRDGSRPAVIVDDLIMQWVAEPAL